MPERLTYSKSWNPTTTRHYYQNHHPQIINTPPQLAKSWNQNAYHAIIFQILQSKIIIHKLQTHLHKLRNPGITMPERLTYSTSNNPPNTC